MHKTFLLFCIWLSLSNRVTVMGNILSNSRTDSSVQTELREKYFRVRNFSETLCQTLAAEDCCIQSMPDVSPLRWHLAHTTWFFETFVLARDSTYQPAQDSYAYLFNSYYNALGDQFPRERRGLLSRPTVEEVWGYRRQIDERMEQVLESLEFQSEVAAIIDLGLNHEQQHQELMLTDIKHVFSCNPLAPQFRPGKFSNPDLHGNENWTVYDEGLYWIGHDGSAFAYDNEGPAHREFLHEFRLKNRLVTCLEYVDFINDGGYRRPELWLAEGWRVVQDRGWQAPLYWTRQGNEWLHFTLAGMLPLEMANPVCHVSYFEADAYARWAGARLPTEAEWEVASVNVSTKGNHVDRLLGEGLIIHPNCRYADDTQLSQMFGDVWQWTSSSYAAYPGYVSAPGAIGEYNGKFMCNQYTLRGGSCATSSDHIRRTYRNFFPTDARWQFSGIRLAQ